MNYIMKNILIVIFILNLFSVKAQTAEEKSLNDYIDGKISKYSSKGEGKSQGLKINLSYPSSWEANDGERPHIVKKFQQSDGYVLALLFINKTDAIITESEILEVMTTEGLKSVIPVSGKYISSNSNLKIEGLKAGSVEYTDENKRVDITIYTHNLAYLFFYKQYLVMVQFYVTGSLNESHEQIDARFNRTKTLFPLIFNSVVIENIWE